MQYTAYILHEYTYAIGRPETPLQALDAVHGGIIAAMVARAVNGLDVGCNAIGGGGCPVGSIAIGGCPIAYALDIATGCAWTKEKPSDVAEGGCYSSVV